VTTPRPVAEDSTSKGQWYLAQRMRIWYLASTVGVVLVAFFLGETFLRQSHQREILGLLREEADEFSILFMDSERSEAVAANILEAFHDFHPQVPMAGRIWLPGESDPWTEVGNLNLLQEFLPNSQPLDQVMAMAPNTYARVTELPSGHRVALVMGMHSMAQVLQRYRLFASLLGLAAVGLGLLLGEIFSRRISRQLRNISEAVRKVRSSAEDLQVPLRDAPEEIRAVLQAFGEMLQSIRAENENSRLMIAGLAHELGSPVQNMLGETEVLLQNEIELSESRRVIEVYQDELHHLADAVHNLVTLCSSKHNDPDPTAVERFDLGREAGFRLLREQAAAGKRQVTLNIATLGELELNGDKEAILRALRNVVSNAVSWSPVGATVEVMLDGSHSEFIQIVVDDAGPGVPVEQRARIFDMLYRGSGAKGRRIGYGLGLALAHTAISSHQGTIQVASSPAGGARFDIRLPRCT
jgi:two-component system, OmpR family, heavy metal sensor histidine kinase CusS